jgi:hypothetical protein
LKGFLRKLFVCQKDEVAKALGKKWCYSFDFNFV